MEYQVVFNEFADTEYEELTCDADDCEQIVSYIVSHDTYYREGKPMATCRGNCVCKAHVIEAIDELIEDYGKPNGDNVKIRVTELLPPKE